MLVVTRLLFLTALEDLDFFVLSLVVIIELESSTPTFNKTELFGGDVASFRLGFYYCLQREDERNKLLPKIDPQ